MRVALAALLVVAGTLPALAQTKTYEIQKPSGTWQQPGPIQQPKGNWQVPGEIQVPKGTWQVPGEIQVPKGIQALRATSSGCERRLSVIGDALFDFDKSNLRPDAEETLAAAGPEIAKLGGKPARVEGHTDAIGSDAYNMKLSEARATTVRDWLAARSLVPAATPIKGYGKTKPIAPNATSDGRDDPEGRQKNRRVEVVLDACS
jgi:outer membrane protein OmpA-like peptidoglycan-associated protein